MSPAMLMALSSMGKGGGSTKVSQSSSNTSYAAITANISGISSNPTSGSNAATQTTPSGAVASSQPNSSGNLLDNILASASGGSGYGAGYGTYDSSTGTVDSITAPTSGLLGNSTMLMVVGGVGALAAAVWLFMKKGR